MKVWYLTTLSTPTLPCQRSERITKDWRLWWLWRCYSVRKRVRVESERERTRDNAGMYEIIPGCNVNGFEIKNKPDLAWFHHFPMATSYAPLSLFKTFSNYGIFRWRYDISQLFPLLLCHASVPRQRIGVSVCKRVPVEPEWERNVMMLERSRSFQWMQCERVWD